ncbi:putative F-box protein [Cardamine amara subsp. amara]|uniref:F-box protein n=1 Tax=Cardamine amara subsp. amara TaxID=228776 RepID=A0ABD1ACS9_CARAN
MADWSFLPKDLLERISDRFETYFEIVHFRSVCGSWRSAIPKPSYRRGLGVESLLPIFNHNSRFEGETHCELKKIPAFLLRFKTPFGADYLFVGMSQSKSCKQKLLSPLTDSGLASKYGIILNTLSSQIIPLGYYYKINFNALTTNRSRTSLQSYSTRAAFLPLGGENGTDFAVIAGVLGDLMIYKSCDKRWTKIEGRFQSYRDMVSFRGKFYVVDTSGRGHVFVIEPSLEISEIQAVTQSLECFHERLVVSGGELLLVQRITPGKFGHEYMHTWCRLFRLEDKEGQRRWVQISDLEDRVLFLGIDWNLCYSAEELLGMKGNCVVFIIKRTTFEGIFVFDFGTRKTSTIFTGCRDFIGAFGENRESFTSCGIVTAPNPADGFY